MKEITVIFAFTLMWSGLCQGESVRGVLYATSAGASAKGSGVVRLAAGRIIYDLYYSKPLPAIFQSATCSDIGAVWSVEISPEMDIICAQCDGKVDESVHRAWLLIGRLLNELQHVSRFPIELFSAQWAGSDEGKASIQRLRHLDFSRYLTLGTGPRCLEVVSFGSAAVEIQTGPDCHILSDDILTDLRFDVARKGSGNGWQIVGVQMQ